MRESGLRGRSWVISLFLIVILVGFMAGTVVGEASQSQPDIGVSEPLTVSGPEGSDTTQQDGTIEMDHVQVAVRASKTQVTPGERVQITYDGVAFPGNPEPLNIQIIATIPSGVTASDMRAEGCGPQCPITDQQLRPSDKLSAGSFTITPQEVGDHDIDIRATYTFANGSTKSWSKTTRVTVSTEPEATPDPESGIDEVHDYLSAPYGYLLLLLLGFVGLIFMIYSYYKPQLGSVAMSVIMFSVSIMIFTFELPRSDTFHVIAGFIAAFLSELLMSLTSFIEDDSQSYEINQIWDLVKYIITDMTAGAVAFIPSHTLIFLLFQYQSVNILDAIHIYLFFLAYSFISSSLYTTFLELYHLSNYDVGEINSVIQRPIVAHSIIYVVVFLITLIPYIGIPMTP